MELSLKNIIEEVSIENQGFNVTHLNAFKDFFHDLVLWKGKIPSKFAKTLGNVDSAIIETLPAKTSTRVEVEVYCADPANSVESCFLVIAAWGGMRKNHAQRAWAARDQWKPILLKMREGTLSGRRALYECFLSSSIPGLGPAYFTKLMYFMSRGESCFIFDQWTGRSTNLLLRREKALVNFSNNWLTRKNNADVYCTYCKTVEALASMIEVSCEVVEEKMFAGGGMHRWRAYVKSQVPVTGKQNPQRHVNCGALENKSCSGVV